MKKQISKTKNEASVTFSISAEMLNGAKKASVVGEFNNWDVNATLSV